MATIAAKSTKLVQPDYLSFFAAGVTVLLWASAFAGIRVGLRSYSPESVALLRYLVASLVLGIYAATQKFPLPSRRDLIQIGMIGFFGFAVYNVALNEGARHVSAGTASFIIASAPIMMAILANVVRGEKLKTWGWIGIAISFSGVAIIAIAKDGHLELNLSVLVIMLAALSQAIYSVYQKPLLSRYSTVQFLVYAVWGGTLFLLPFAPRLYGEIQTASSESTLAIIYMGIFPGALAYACWSFVLSRVSAAVAGSFIYLVPAFAVIIAWFWLGEVPQELALVGGTLIIAGVMVVNLRGRAQN